MPKPKNIEKSNYFFTDDIRFFQKAIIVHPNENKFLMVKRSNIDKIRPGTWDLPGGNISFGELHRDALKREILEETSLKVRNIREVKVITHFDKNQKIYFIIIGSICRASTEIIKLSSEHSAFKWMTKDEFLGLDPNYQYKEERILDTNSADFLRDIVYSAFNFKSN
ncbi:NUDIX domain-containing protein [Candidatus Roizmanbacteria bacterium]|nr:NUDIX domain-containing protein [Candidatus Roizmanbacteria bacterium]